MSHTGLRRVVIRMLHDAGFVEAVYTTPDRALAGLELTATEREWLRSTPRAAWGTDPDRPGRLLAALWDEFPASLRFAAARAAHFLSSAPFHDAVQSRGSLTLALGAYLADAPDPRAANLARVETAIAATRRAPQHPVPSPEGRLRRSPCAHIVAVASGTLALLEATRQSSVAGRLGPGIEHLLVVRAASSGEVTVEVAQDGLAHLLSLAAKDVSRSTLTTAAVRLGAEPHEAEEIVDRLVADGLLA